MKKEIITIATNNGTSQTGAELFSIDGFDEMFAVHKSEDYVTEKNVWHVTELSTGMSVCGDFKTKADAIKGAAEKMNKYKKQWPDVLKKSLKMLKKIGIKFPVNQ